MRTASGDPGPALGTPWSVDPVVSNKSIPRAYGVARVPLAGPRAPTRASCLIRLLPRGTFLPPEVG